LTHAPLSYFQGSSVQIPVLATDFISQADSTGCPLLNCIIVDSTTLKTPSFLTITFISGLSYTINLKLDNTLTSTLIFNCNGNNNLNVTSNSFPLGITCT